MGKNELILNNQHYIAIGNDLILAKSDLTATELKLLRTVITNIKPNDEDFLEYKTTIKELAEFLDIPNNHLYEDINTICRHLLQEIIEIYNTDTKKLKLFQWCSICEYDSGEISIQLHPKLKPYLIKLKDKGYYTQYQLENIIQLNSVYSIRIYELIQNKLKGKINYPIIINITIEELRKATDTEDKYINDNGMFHKRVIEAAIKEINEKLHYSILAYPKTERKKYTSYDFIISRIWS